MKKNLENNLSGTAGKSARDKSELKYKNPNSANSWEKGAIGEEAAGKVIEKLCSEHNFKFLHDRRIVGTKRNIDHILITNRGIFVIDAKNYKGSVRIKESGGIFRSFTETLYVGGRNQTKLVSSVINQVELVAASISKLKLEIPVFGVLAFYNADFPVFFKPKKINGVFINSKGIESVVLTQEIVCEIDLDPIHKHLASMFPSY